MLQSAENQSNEFKMDIEELRARAREEMEKGALIQNYSMDADKIKLLLNIALATELVCMLRYRSHASRTVGPYSDPIKKKLMEFGREEDHHAQELAERIMQLDGEPDFDPETLLSRSHSEFRSVKGLLNMLKEDLIAERVVIETYQEMVRFIGDRDPVTRRLFGHILEEEEKHADELSDLIRSPEVWDEKQWDLAH